MISRVKSAFGVAVFAFIAATDAKSQNVTWNQLAPTRAVPSRVAAASAYDPVSGLIILFGGVSGNFPFAVEHDDTWTFDGSTWRKLSPRTSPSKRSGSMLVFDEPSQKLVLFGGFDGTTVTYFNDTWIFDGASLTWRQTYVPNPPHVRSAMSAFRDPSTGRVAFFGGTDGTGFFNDMVRWNGLSWDALTPSSSPSARASAATAFDPVRNNVVLFSGLNGSYPQDTWTWDGNDWTQQSPSQQPPTRDGGGACFEPHLGGVVVFGGTSPSSTYMNDTWIWDGTDWTQLQPATAPSGRTGFSMSFDAALDRIVVAGGAYPYNTETWTFIDEGDFVDLGPGIGGSLGAPTLSGSGDLSSGSPLGFTLDLGNAPPSNLGVLFAGLTNGSVPFAGGTFYPFPVLTAAPCQTDPSGAAQFSSSIPSGVPSGTSIVLQAWFVDGSAPKGLSGTNGLEAIVP
jgi:hypothetical protein